MENIRGYKVTDENGICRKGHSNEQKYETGKEYTFPGQIKICNSGYHFCIKAAHCFSYYSFDSKNKVFEVESFGEYQTHAEDSKVCTNKLRIIRELSWDEVLKVSNDGKNNTGHSNSGNWNSGNWNSGNWNSGYRNSGDSNSGNWNSGNWNSGNWNSGYRNSGDRNSGNWNSGNWNSGNWNSGYSNSGNRNSGAFCSKKMPFYLFNKKSNWTEKEFENSLVYRLMCSVDICIWVPLSIMTEEEKQNNPKAITTTGYLKTITYKEAFKNAWFNWNKESRQAFLDLPNFDATVFFEITGVQV